MGAIIYPTWSTHTARPITQLAHGFLVGSQVYFDGVSWLLAQADDPASLRMATVAQIIDADRFLLAFEGVMAWPAHGLTLGTNYFLSADTAGTVTPTEPITAGAITQVVLVPIDVDHVRLVEFVETGGGANRNAISALIPANTVPAPGATGFRLRLLQLPSTESTGTLHLSWKRGNSTSWSGIVAFTTFVTPNGGSGFSMKMLTGRFGWGTVQLVQDNNQAYLELVSSGSWGYLGGSNFDVFFTFAAHNGNRGVILSPPVEATTGTVVASISDSYLANTLGNLDDVDLTGVS